MTHEDIRVEYVTMTPEWAATLLKDYNTQNRGRSHKLVDQYGRQMGARDFPFWGQAIVLSQDGTVLDGQHRLEGCVNSDTAFDTLLVSNVPAERQKFIDAGRRRSAGDMLSIMGVQYASQVTSAARLQLSWLFWVNSGGQSVNYGNAEVSDYALKHLSQFNAGLLAARAMASSVDGIGPRKVSPPAIMAVYARALQVTDNPFTVNTFFQKVATGLGLKSGDPERTLRQKFNAQPKANSHRDLYWLIRAWNASMLNQGIGRLQEPHGGLRKSSYEDLVAPTDPNSEEHEEYLALIENYELDGGTE